MRPTWRVHLGVALDTIGNRGGLGMGEEPVLPIQRMSPAVVALTATGDSIGNRFDLDADDMTHAEIKKRLEALKPLSISNVETNNPTRAVTEATKELLDTLELDSENARGILVFVNSPRTALAVAKALRSRCDCEIVVATGRIRGAEARKTVSAIMKRMKAGSSDFPERQGNKHLLVIATQTLEVGADLDADYMITEACGFRALTQRLGRLNRFGLRPHARAVYVHVEPKDGNWPVYGTEPTQVLEQLQVAEGFDEEVDMSPGNIGHVLGDLPAESTDAPVLAAALLWEWTKTSAPPPGEAPVEPYFSGFLEQGRDVEIIWRAHVPEPGNRIWPRISPDEVVSIPAFEAQKELADADCIRVASDQTTAEQVPKGDRGEPVLRPGDTVVVSCKTAKLNDNGHWDPTAKELTMDASLLGSGLVISSSTLPNLYGKVPADLRAAMDDLVVCFDDASDASQPEEIESAARRFCVELVNSDVPPSFDQDDRRDDWNEFARKLRDGIESQDLPQVIVEPDREAPRLALLRERGLTSRVSFDEYDELSIADPVSLEAHGNDTARIARRIACAEGISRRTAEVIEIAARLHDVGKADLRFQNWLNPHRDHPGPVAKSDIPRSQWESWRVASGWPRGGRHEELSRRLAQAWLAEGDQGFDENEQALLLHLVVAHHGNGRPLVTPVSDRNGVKVDYQINGRDVEAKADLSVVDWDQPARFAALNSRYGCWGLALLEAVVRQADHLVSNKAQKLEIR